MDKYYIIKELAGMQVNKVELTEEELEEIKRCLHCEPSIDNSITYAKIRKVLE